MSKDWGPRPRDSLIGLLVGAIVFFTVFALFALVYGLFFPNTRGLGIWCFLLAALCAAHSAWATAVGLENARMRKAAKRRATRLRNGRCPNCNYLLKGLSSPRCPECGTEFDPDQLGDGRD
jgi:hypothetical protein